MIKRVLISMFAVGVLGGVFGATVQQQKVKRLFASPSSAELKALKATIGKPFESGYVFVAGKYLKPPYRIERYGTVLRVNGIQVSGPVVSWNAFAKTQDGARAIELEPAEPVGVEPEPVPERKKAVVAEAEDDDEETTLDDLFEDDDGGAAASTSVSAAAETARPKARRVRYVFDGGFVLNDRARALLDKVNAERAQVERILRAGGYVCFGRRYARVEGRPDLAQDLMEKLPDLMKRHPEHDDFARAARQEGLVYLPTPLIDDFFTNRFDYLLLASRKRSDAERKAWRKLTGD